MSSADTLHVLKERVKAEVDRLAPELLDASRFLHANPELAYEEFKAAERLTAILERGDRALLLAAKAMAMTAVALLAQPDTLAEVGAEFGGQGKEQRA